MISQFNGRYAFLSNFFPCIVRLDEEVARSVEHAYQAAKAVHPVERRFILGCGTSNQAKKEGRNILLRDDWEQVRIPIMLDLLRQKFSTPDLRMLLDATEDEELVEGNSWGDDFWGVCTENGQNHLGKLLMQVRREGKV